MPTFLERIANLPNDARRLLAESLAADAEDDGQLVAYVVEREGRQADPAELRDFLRARLPDYMVPKNVVFLTALPRTPNGKLDARALPDPPDVDDAVSDTFVAPRNEVEAALAKIWSEVLGFEDIGVHDNFFEIGGDSILSIRIVALAREGGIRMTPDLMFDHQTIAELARHTATVEPEPGEAVPAPSGDSGTARLTPIQHWFFEQEMAEPDHWNQSVTLTLKSDFGFAAVQAAVDRLVERHPVLSARFDVDSGLQEFASGSRVAVENVDLSAVGEGGQQELLNDVVVARLAAAEAGLSISAGPVIRVTYFDSASTRAAEGALVHLAIHHLVVDPVSWHILLNDLDSFLLDTHQVNDESGGRSSFESWRAALGDYALSDRLRDQTEFWLSQVDPVQPGIPVDFPNARCLEKDIRTSELTLTEERSRELLIDATAAYGTQVDEMLIAALALTLASWQGGDEIFVGVERHGREAVGEGLDLSGTVGWFTSFFPLRIRLPDGAGADLGGTIKSIKEQLRGVPDRGVGYGVARYLHPESEIREALGSGAQPRLIFNYAGRVDGGGKTETAFQEVGEIGSSRAPTNHRGHVLEVNSFVVGGKLTVRWQFSTSVHRETTVTRLAEAFMEHVETLVVHCLDPDAGGYTPSDFPDVDLSQDDLDALLGNL